MAAAARTALTASPATPFSRLRLPGQIRGTCGLEDGGALRSPGASIHLGIIRLKIQANRWAIGRSMEKDGPRYSSAGALGLAACQRGHRVRFTTASALVSELIEARDEKHLLRFQKLLTSYELLIVDELGFVPLSKTGAELLFETFSQRYERASTLVTSNLPFQEWTEVFGSERLTGALLDRLTHHVHILEMNGDSYRLKHSRRKRTPPTER